MHNKVSMVLLSFPALIVLLIGVCVHFVLGLLQVTYLVIRYPCEFPCLVSAWATAICRGLVTIATSLFVSFAIVLFVPLNTKDWTTSNEYGINDPDKCSCECVFVLSVTDLLSLGAVTLVLIVTNLRFLWGWIKDGFYQNQHLYSVNYRLPLRLVVSRQDNNPAGDLLDKIGQHSDYIGTPNSFAGEPFFPASVSYSPTHSKHDVDESSLPPLSPPTAYFDKEISYRSLVLIFSVYIATLAPIIGVSPLLIYYIKHVTTVETPWLVISLFLYYAFGALFAYYVRKKYHIKWDCLRNA
ncbi:hypothetical protein RFI_14241 [Reticulomyxa filosa]|uniref:Uncharacterized protein n=1 Tax=Reticulomyxa filosa TaxID=46433 RepID=X6NAB8_RETFI|nr:hypothetical protein RFI_14241 [Reticulomyxa filosa]|eukprot:ETO22951.1 hypothetical protein RFI_14241 [Reticulomyxa filosa]